MQDKFKQCSFFSVEKNSLFLELVNKQTKNLFCHLDHVNLDVELSKVLEKMGDTEDDIGTTFLKFAVVTRELSNLMKNLVIITSN